MKKTLVILLILLPAISFGQIGDDGKTETTSGNVSTNVSSRNILLYSFSTAAPFGLKYIRCKSFGFYANFKSDFGLFQNFYLATVGIAKSVGNKSVFYIGAGPDFGYYEYDWNNGRGSGIVAESGFAFKIKKVAIDIGLGLIVDAREYYGSYGEDGNLNTGFLNIGIGFVF